MSIDRNLVALQPGSRLGVRETRGRIEQCDEAVHKVAMLSGAVARVSLPGLTRISWAQVLAMIDRN